jgi:hypothetical protein
LGSANTWSDVASDPVGRNYHSAALLLPDRHELQRTFRFLGRVLGKALYENVAIAPQFAHFFLAHMQGRYQWAQLLSDLAAFDAELARNLLFLRSYDGDVDALELSFALGSVLSLLVLGNPPWRHPPPGRRQPAS